MPPEERVGKPAGEEMQDVLNAQQGQWQQTFSERPEMFGANPSDAARAAAELFSNEHKHDLLELGAGQGRDTFFFVNQGFRVTALDYSDTAVATIRARAAQAGFLDSVTATAHDVRQPLPFSENSFDACYSHMLFCMALTKRQLGFLSGEVRRVLRPGGLHVYTVRHTGDSHYRTGTHRGEQMYEVGGFIVHFFDRAMVEELGAGYELLDVEEFHEGNLPRKLWRVTLRK